MNIKFKRITTSCSLAALLLATPAAADYALSRDYTAYLTKVAVHGADIIETKDGKPSIQNVADAIHKLGNNVEEYVGETKRRFDSLEARLNRPGVALGGGGVAVSDEEIEHKQAFLNWVKNPDSATAKANLEAKAVAIGTDTAGGFAVPSVISRDIYKRLVDLSPLRRLSRVEKAESETFKKLVDIRGAASGWVGEGDVRSETGTPTLQEVVPTFGMVYAYPKASEESIDDIFFDVEAWLIDSVSTELNSAEGAAFVLGDGTKKPTGFLAGTPVATGDTDSPARAFGTLQYIATGFASDFGPSRVDSPPGDPADVLQNTIYTLRAGYRRNATWLMNSTTAGVFRNWKDLSGRFLWADSLQAGQPPLLSGHPVHFDENMPDIGANAFPVAFGDFRAGYLIVDVANIRATRDEITTPGQVKFYVRKRVGGKILDDQAIKLIKVATS